MDEPTGIWPCFLKYCNHRRSANSQHGLQGAINLVRRTNVRRMSSARFGHSRRFESAMKIGLALSGGGFRAPLYHLGLVRFLRDAGILNQVTHITSVSGGSIMAAHLVLKWKQYTGSAEDFDQAAAKLLAFTRLDVLNR